MLGPQAGALHLGTTTDPLERLLGGSTYSLGGAARYLSSLTTAITTFIQRAYPKAGEKGLVVVPGVPSTTEDITWEEVTRHMVKERHGGLLAGNFSCPDLPTNLPTQRMLPSRPCPWTHQRGEPSTSW